MTFEEVQAKVKEGKVLVDFYAQWCGPCKMMMPAVDELISEGHNILKVDIDQVPEVKEAYDVMAVPTFLLFEDGQPCKRVTGFVPKELLEALIG